MGNEASATVYMHILLHGYCIYNPCVHSLDQFDYFIAHSHKLITHDIRSIMYFSGLFHNVSVIEMNMFPLHCSWVSVFFPQVQWCNFLTDNPVELCSTI